MTATGLEGRKIVEVRPMTKDELAELCWDDPWERSAVLVLDDGTKVFPSIDQEGNGPGCLFGVDDQGPFTISAYTVEG